MGKYKYYELFPFSFYFLLSSSSTHLSLSIFHKMHKGGEFFFVLLKLKSSSFNGYKKDEEIEEVSYRKEEVFKNEEEEEEEAVRKCSFSMTRSG